MTGKELKDILSAKGIVLKNLADSLDISPQTLNSRLNAKSIKSDFLREISEFTGLNFQFAEREFDNFMLVPVYNLDAVGGLTNTETDVSEFIIDYIPFKNAKSEDISVPVTNNSMYPMFPPGCYVQLRKIELWKTYLELGQVYVIELEDDRRLLKQIKKGHDKEHFLLSSFNNEYDDTEVPTNFIKSVWLVLAKYQKSVM